VRALKILVVTMGLLVVAGVTALVVVIAGRLSQPRQAAMPASVSAAAPIELPAGARVESIGVGTDRLAVGVVLPDGDRRIMIIDLATGRQLGAVPLHTAK
jgi:hypothetical protein